jgi:hypothetical protein
MHKARLTTAGAMRIGHPELTEQIIEYDEVHDTGECVCRVYWFGKQIAGVVSFIGDTPGLVLLDDTSDPMLVLV